MTIFKLEDASPELPGEGQYFIAPNAMLIGKVILELMASVWFGAVLRGDNEPIHIGERSNVQDGCVLHTDLGYPLTIAEECTIGHLAMLHGCTVERNCLIGIGSTVLNGARIGENSIIGAHALIPEGKDIPPNSLVMGTPGRVVRQISDEDARGINKLSRHYTDKVERYGKSFSEQKGG